MKFKSWIRKSGKRPIDVANALGVYPSTVHRYMVGERTPHPEIMMKIQRLTDGKVTLEDWIA
jgi:DNA-binding transcriptional regulator YdaS (Cro superfamily)